jgi:DNA-binding response OmpR family regulator
MKTARDKGRILVVDDERSMREMLEIFLGREGYAVSSCARCARRTPTFPCS